MSLGSHQQKFIARQRAFLLVLVVGVIVALRCIQTSVDPWHMTHWSFTYEHGFIKRGLVGEITSHIFGTVTPTIITFVVWGIFLLLAVALTYWFIQPAWNNNRIGAWLFASMAMISSATIPHFQFDFGRFDQINLLIFLMCLVIVRLSATWLQHIAVFLLCTMGLLIHEAFLLMFIPVIFAVWLYEERIQWIWPKIFALTGLVAIDWTIDTYGVMQGISEQAYMAELQKRHSFNIHPDSVHVLYRTVKDNVIFNFDELRKYARPNITNHIVFTFTLIPTAILFYKLTRELCFYNKTREAFWRFSLVVSALAPLFLYFLASDSFRWWSIAVTNLFIIFTYLAIHLNREDNLADVVERSPIVTASILTVSVVFGPLGVMIKSYPFINLGFLPGWNFTW